MKKVVISLGGSILIPTLEEHTIKEYVPVLKKIAKQHRLFVVVGGGGEARRYIGIMRDLGIDEGTSDEIGILITRLNATMLIAALGEDAYPKVAESHAEAKKFAESGKIVVMGGITPGQTTDAVAAVLAERVGAAVFINATSVDGIYSADPRKDKKATRFDSMTPKKLLEIVGGTALGAGSNNVLDIVAARVVERSNIPLVVLDGRDPKNLPNAILKGKSGAQWFRTGRRTRCRCEREFFSILGLLVKMKFTSLGGLPDGPPILPPDYGIDATAPDGAPRAADRSNYFLFVLCKPSCPALLGRSPEAGSPQYYLS